MSRFTNPTAFKVGDRVRYIGRTKWAQEVVGTITRFFPPLPNPNDGEDYEPVDPNDPSEWAAAVTIDDRPADWPYEQQRVRAVAGRPRAGRYEMKLRVLAGIIVLIAVVAFLAVQNARQRTRIADLEERNAALSRLCGPDPTREPYEPLHVDHPVPDVQP